MTTLKKSKKKTKTNETNEALDRVQVINIISFFKNLIYYWCRQGFRYFKHL